MTLPEERMQILKMVENGTITAEDAAKLLGALEEGVEKEEAAETPGGGQYRARWLRVRVTDEATGRRKVNVNLPMGLVNLGLKIGTKFAPDMKDLDVDEIFEAIRTGAHGKIVEVEDDEDGERVEIFVE